MITFLQSTTVKTSLRLQEFVPVSSIERALEPAKQAQNFPGFPTWIRRQIVDLIDELEMRRKQSVQLFKAASKRGSAFI
jgi:hypothetical protein